MAEVKDEAGESGQVMAFSNVINIVRGDRSEGSMRLNSKGFAFKAKATGTVITGVHCTYAKSP